MSQTMKSKGQQSMQNLNTPDRSMQSQNVPGQSPGRSVAAEMERMAGGPCRTARNCGQMSRAMLLDKINTVSFAVNDITLYLDTHPEDKEALDYFNHYLDLRRYLLEEYENHYGPLTIDTAEPHEIWSWVMTPNPWEGGRK